jgi:hypothetical protein
MVATIFLNRTGGFRPLACRIPRLDRKLVSDHPHSGSLLDRSSLIVPPARPKTAMRDAAERSCNFRPEEK